MTYQSGVVATWAIYQVRFLIGDTVTSEQLLEDAEIAFAISLRSNIYGAAAECCRSLASKFSRSVTQRAGGSISNFSDMSKAYAARALQFDSQAAQFGAGMPYAGGISESDKLSQEQDGDRVPPQFIIGMDDNTLPVTEAGPVLSNPGLSD